MVNISINVSFEMNKSVKENTHLADGSLVSFDADCCAVRGAVLTVDKKFVTL